MGARVLALCAAFAAISAVDALSIPQRLTPWKGRKRREARVRPSPEWEQKTRARIDVLTQRLTADRLEMTELERRLQCCAPPPPPPDAAARGSLLEALRGSATVFRRRFEASASPVGFVANETSAGLRILGDLVLLPAAQRRAQIATLRKHAPLLVVHAPGILSRLDRLERYVPGIVTEILDGDHLASVEPHLDAILERFDEIEPHLPWVLDNIDALAPYVGSLMRHIDELLLYADEEYRWADDFLPYLPFFVSRLDALGPHLPLLRPHLKILAPHFRTLVPCVDRCLLEPRAFDVSANADVLLWWFSWAFRVPLIPRAFAAMPGGPSITSFLARRLPRRFVRDYCSGIQCYVSYEYGSFGRDWNRLSYADDYDAKVEALLAERNRPKYKT